MCVKCVWWGCYSTHREEGELLLEGQLAVAAVAHPKQHPDQLPLVLLCRPRRRRSSRRRSSSSSEQRVSRIGYNCN